ncbi:hypothetical protein I4U23_024374 [Adineta vaga]|nr:hypothetical protein I4U23_024374 [Adineta vaga]
METSVVIVASFQLILFGMSALLALFYFFIVVLVRRLHDSSNIFAANICLACVLCAIFLSVFIGFEQFNLQGLFFEEACFMLVYFNMLCPLQVTLAFVTFTVYRFCTIIYYTKLFFSRKSWVIICISSQWIAGFLIPTPILFRSKPQCIFWTWIWIYSLVMVVIVPSIICLILNIIIFTYARSFSRRIHPQTLSGQVNSQESDIFYVRRRDLKILRQMLHLFCIFVGSWGPVYLTLILERFIEVSPIVIPILIFIGELAILTDIIGLFKTNQKMKDYLRHKVRGYFRP